MEDDELVRIAAFKLRDSANRLMTLANEAQSEKVRGQLHAVCEQLLLHEKKVFGLQPSNRAG